MSDGFLLNDGNIKVGNGILYVNGVTCPIRSINSIRATASDNGGTRGIGVILIIIGVVFLFQRTAVTFMIGAVLGVVGYLMYKNIQEVFHLFVKTIGGEIQIVESKDKLYVQKVRDCIESCIAIETQPRIFPAGSNGQVIDATAIETSGFLPRT